MGEKRRLLGDSPLQHSWFYTDLFFGLQVFFDYLPHLILGYSTCSPLPAARTASLSAGSGTIRPGTVLPARSREAAVSSYFTGLIFQAPFLNFRPRISRSYPRYGGESSCLPVGFHLSPSPSSYTAFSPHRSVPCLLFLARVNLTGLGLIDNQTARPSLCWGTGPLLHPKG